MKKITFYIFIFIGTSLYAQKHDATWMFGNAGGSFSPQDTTFGISILHFDNSTLSHIENNQTIEMWLNHDDACISDTAGNLLFYYNGIYIEDASYNTMQNGHDISKWKMTGGDIMQGGVILPFPDSPHKYILFHEEQDLPVQGVGNLISHLYYSVIDMTKNGGLGAVVDKKNSIINDTLDYGKVTSCRHANGRDWWVLVFEFNSNKYYRILLTPSGVDTLGRRLCRYSH